MSLCATVIWLPAQCGQCTVQYEEALLWKEAAVLLVREWGSGWLVERQASLKI